MLIGYARTSTTDQHAGFEAQLVELKAYGCERMYQEQVSAVASRQELERAIDMLREGDKLVVTKLDRLARNVMHMGELLEQIEAKGAGLVILSLGSVANAHLAENYPIAWTQLSSESRKLRETIALQLELSLSDHLSDFDAIERRRRGREGFEPKHWTRSPFNKTMVLLNSIIQVLGFHCGDFGWTTKSLEDLVYFADSSSICSALVDHDTQRNAVVGQSLREELLGRRGVPTFG